MHSLRFIYNSPVIICEYQVYWNNRLLLKIIRSVMNGICCCIGYSIQMDVSIAIIFNYNRKFLVLHV